jgi:metal-dependent amidase/aminoacylase/carboxypeptidase family protein
VIPGEALLRGTYRYLAQEDAEVLEARIRSAADAATAGTDVTVQTTLDRTYGLPVVNSPGSFSTFRSLAEAALPGRFYELPEPTMGCEDFAYYLQEREGLMFRLGLGETMSPLHTATFDFNDDAIPNGILMMCLLGLAG